MVSVSPQSGLPSVTEFQYFVTEITILLLKFSWILAKILKFVLISQLFTHKNTEICVKLCKNTEIIAIRYWSEFPEVGSPAQWWQPVGGPRDKI